MVQSSALLYSGGMPCLPQLASIAGEALLVEKTRELTHQWEVTLQQNQQLLQNKDKEIEDLTQSLSNAHVRFQQSFHHVTQMDDVKTQLEAALDRIKQLETCKLSLQTELHTQMEHVQQAMSAVNENQQLANRHLSNAIKYKQEVEEFRTNHKSTLLALDSMSDKVECLDKLLGEKERVVKDQGTTWHKKVEKLKGSLQAQANQLESLHEDKTSLEDANHKLILSNQRLTHSLEKAEGILNVPKADTSAQVGPSLYLMINAGAQVCPGTRSVTVQTRTLTYTSYCQTEPTHMTSSTLTQTEATLTGGCNRRESAAQTVRKILLNKSCGNFDISLYTKDISTQTLLASTTAFLKCSGMPHGSNKSEAKGMAEVLSNIASHSAPRRPILDLATYSRNGEGDLADSLKTPASDSLIECSSYTDDRTVRKGVDKGYVSVEAKANLKGILKDPADNKDKGGNAKSVNFPDSLETRFLISPNPNAGNGHHPSARRPASPNSRPRKSPLQMITNRTAISDATTTSNTSTTSTSTGVGLRNVGNTPEHITSANIKMELIADTSFHTKCPDEQSPLEKRGDCGRNILGCHGNDINLNSDKWQADSDSRVDCKRESLPVTLSHTGQATDLEERPMTEKGDMEAPPCDKKPRLL